MSDDAGGYEYIERAEIKSRDDLRPESLGWHTGSVGDYKRRCDQVAANAVGGGFKGLRGIAPHLLSQILDSRQLRLAAQHVVNHGGNAAGSDGRRPTDYSSADYWEMARALSQAGRDGKYRPSSERIIEITKSSGGTRPIIVLTVADRVVQRTTTMVLQPLLDPFFSPLSFGFRPERGHLRALAAAEEITLSQRRFVWLAADIKSAFENVPIPRLLDVLRLWFPDSGLIDFLGRMLPGKQRPGLRQGGAFSPLGLNLYLHHFLDRKWHSDAANPPLIRVADDVLVLCRTADEACRAYGDLRRLLDPAAMPLKHRVEDCIFDLKAGATARWMGFAISKATKGLRYDVLPSAWGSLETRLALAHTRPDAPLRALRTVKAWLAQRGPAYRATADQRAICRQVLDIAARYGFDEMPTLQRLLNHWQLANGRWRQLRAKAGDLLPKTAGQANAAESTAGSRSLAETGPCDSAPF